MTTTVATWGNSEAVRIPKEILAHAGLKRGDRLNFIVNSRGHVELVPEAPRHRQIAPKKGITFESLFDDWDGEIPSSQDYWADTYVGMEAKAWSQ